MKFSHNQQVTCRIQSTDITDARISIDRDGKAFICQNSEDGCDAENKLGYKYSWILEKDFTRASVSNLKPLTKCWDNLETGDILVGQDGKTRCVMEVMNTIVFVSTYNDHDVVSNFYDKKALQKRGLTIQNLTQPVEEMTLAEVCKELGRTVVIKE